MADSAASGQQPTELSIPDIDIPPQKLGLKTCVPGPSDAEIDIVAIHGIGVDPEDTWVHRRTKTNWLKDEHMLQSRLPRARIMTFGFNSFWYGKNPVRTTIEGVSKKLLNALVKERKKCQDRPIILIGHCFGGIVIQKAYTAAGVHPEDYDGVHHSITGMIFLGTPHSGTRKTDTQAKFYEAIVRANLRIQNELVTAIEYNNESLTDVIYNFTRTVTLRKAPEVFCFYEERATNIGKVLNTTTLEFVVDQTAGTLAGHRDQGLPLNHSDLNKFEDSEDQNYRDVSDEIVRMAESSKMRKKEGKQRIWAQPDTRISSSTLPFCCKPPFANRDGVIERIKTILEWNCRVALVDKTPGSGKTHIAVEYAQIFREENPDSKVYWINGGSSAEFERSYITICNELRINAPPGQKLNEVYQHLQQDVSGHWLMIIDGLDAEGTLEPPESGPAANGGNAIKSLLDYCPTGHLHGGRVLITTRSTAVAGRMVKHQNDCIVEVPPIGDKDAINLILGSETRDASVAELALEVADMLGRSSAGLVLLSICMKILGSDQAEKEYLKDIKHELREPQQIPSSEVLIAPGIVSLWTQLYRRIKKNHHDAGCLLRVMAVLDLQSIPRFLFQPFVSSADYGKLLTLLSDYAMIQTSTKEIYIPPFVRLCVQDSMRHSGDGLSAAELALSLVCQQYPRPGLKPEVCEVLQPAALAASKLPGDSEETQRKRAELLFKMGAFAEHARRRRTSADYFERCLELREKDPEQQESQIAETKRALEQAKFTDSAATAEPASSVLTDGLEDPERVRVTSNRAAALYRCGSRPNLTNIQDFQRIYDWCKGHYGPGHVDTGRNKFNLALSRDVQGQYKEAEGEYMQACETLERSLCRDSSEMIFAIQGSLGRMYCTQGRLHDAKIILQEVIARQDAYLGPDHPDTLISRHNAALLAQEHGDLENAGAEIRRILETRIRLLGIDDPDTLGSVCSLALNFRQRGQLDKAKRFYRLVHRQQMHILGEEHADTVTTKLMLAELLQELGETDEAKNAYKEVQQKREGLLGRDHDEVRYVKRKIQELDAMIG